MSIRGNKRCIIVLAGLLVQGGAQAQEPEPAVTEFGAKMASLVESYHKSADGSPLFGENGWLLLEQLVKIVDGAIPPQSGEEDAVPLDVELLFLPSSVEEWTKKGKDIAAVRAKAEEFIQTLENRGAFTKLAELAANKKFIRASQGGDLINWKLPETGKSRQLARVNGARMRAAADAGDWRTVVEAYEQSLALARIFRHQASAIEQLVGIAIRAYANGWLSEVLCERMAPPEVLRSLVEAISRQDAAPPLTLAVEGERLIGLDTLRMVYDDNAMTPWQMLGKLADTDFDAAQAKTAQRIRPVASKEETRKFLMEMYDRAGAAVKLPPAEASRAVIALEDWIEVRPEEQILGGLMLPAIDKLIRFAAQGDAENRAVRVCLALEMFRAAKGSYPESLDALVPEFLETVPKDPYSAQSLRYKQVDATRSYMVYSVGFDGNDDDGKMDAAKPFEGLSEKGQGLDWVIWPRCK